MKTIALESLAAFTILTFCENLAELGCPMKEEPDMWFRNLTDEEQINIGSKLLDIIERNEAYDKEYRKMHQDAKRKIEGKKRKSITLKRTKK